MVRRLLLVAALAIFGMACSSSATPPSDTVVSSVSAEWSTWAATNLQAFQSGVKELTAVHPGDQGQKVVSHLESGVGYYDQVTALPEAQGQALFDAVKADLQAALMYEQEGRWTAATRELQAATRAQNDFIDYLRTKL